MEASLQKEILERADWGWGQAVQTDYCNVAAVILLFSAVIALFFPLRFDKKSSDNKNSSEIGEFGRKFEQHPGCSQAPLLPVGPTRGDASMFGGLAL